MPVQRIAARCGTARARCILLPGARSAAADFITEGFVADLHAAAPACEVWLADAHLGYVVEGQLLARLRADVVQPAGGAPKPWLVGISLGGFAALAYATHHADDIAGVLALAPYLGRRELLRDIVAAGGLEAWSATPAEPRGPYEAMEALEEDMWRWVVRQSAGRAGWAAPPVFLGHGRDDRFADAHRMLQSRLPAAHTQVVPGGHDWPPWRTLWQQWLRQGRLMPGGATAGAAGCGETQ
jgi:pimeloyl-ACP methyl ester carboxylesterase